MTLCYQDEDDLSVRSVTSLPSPATIALPSMDLTTELATETAVAEERRTAFARSIPRALIEFEDHIPKVLRASREPPKRKLYRIYKLVDQIAEVRAPHVACGKGCADCCRMNVMISAEEARFVSSATGAPHREFSASIAHSTEEFVGSPCPFLVNDACSIYEHRPLACRAHASFFTTAKWCAPDYLNSVEVPIVRFSGLTDALMEASAQRGEAVFADIRDFFLPSM